MKRLFYTFPIIAVLLQGCYLFKLPEKNAPLTSRYSGTPGFAPLDGDSAPIKVDFQTDVIPDPDKTPKTILDFKNGAQKELVDYIIKNSTADNLPAKLNLKLKDKPDDGPNKDYTTKNINITISVTPRDFFEGAKEKKPAFGDRLEKINYVFTIDNTDTSMTFKSWNKITTQFARNYVGSASYTGVHDLTINPSIPIGAGSLSLGSFDLSNTYTEVDTIAPQFVQSNGILHPKTFTIEQNGTAKTSIFGNINIQISLLSKRNESTYVWSTDNLNDDKGELSDPKKVKLSEQVILFPMIAREKLKGKLVCQYMYRHIETGLNTFSESDDQVTYQYGTVTLGDLTLLTKKDLRPTQFELYYNNQYLVFNDKTLPDQRHSFLNATFKTYEEAITFLNWYLKAIQKSGTGIVIADKYEVKMMQPGNPVPQAFTASPDITQFGILKIN